MDQPVTSPDQAPVGAEQAGGGTPGGAPRLEHVGDTWAPGVGSVQVGPRGRRFRWAVAICTVLVVSLVTVAGAFVLSGAAGATKSLTAGYAPKDTAVFLDVRADLPGDQHQNLADFMSHFPGGKDRAQFDGAFNDILNRITGAISPDLTYTWALRDWTTGEVSLAVTSFGSLTNQAYYAVASALASQDPGLAPLLQLNRPQPSGVLIVALKDRAAGEKWVTSEIARTGVQFVAQDYAGTSLYVAQQATGGLTMAYAFTDKVLLAGEVGAVKAALDAPSQGSLAGAAGYSAAMKALSGDCIATFYADPAALLRQELGALSGPNLDLSSMPAWVAGSVRAEADRIAVEIKMPKAAGSLSPGNRESALASQLPGSTVGVLEIHSIGSLVGQGLTAFTSALPSSQAQVGKQIQDALSVIGGVDWIGDGAVVLTGTGTTYGGGLVIKTPDNKTAAGKKAMITNLISLAGSAYGITQTDETYKGTTITTIRVPTGTSGGPVLIGVAVKDDLLVAGYGDAFAKDVIDTEAGNSLASQSDFRTVMAAAGKSNFEYGYWNVPATVHQIGQALLRMNPDAYNLNYKPYFDHLGGVAFASIDGSTVTLRFVVTAR